MNTTRRYRRSGPLGGLGMPPISMYQSGGSDTESVVMNALDRGTTMYADVLKTSQEQATQRALANAKAREAGALARANASTAQIGMSATTKWIIAGGIAVAAIFGVLALTRNARRTA